MSADTEPTLTLEVAFGSDPLAASPTWTDISSKLREYSVTRGRTEERARVDAGVATFVLDNRDRAFDPTFTTGPYYPNVLPMRQIRLRAKAPGNLLSADSSSFETAVGGWAALTNCTVARSTAQAYDGSASLAVTSVGAGAMGALLTTDRPAATPGRVYLARARVRAAAVARGAQLRLRFYTAAAVELPSSLTPSFVTDSTTGWVDIDLMGIAPDTSATLAVEVNWQTTGAGEVHYVDLVAVVAGPTPDLVATGYNLLSANDAGFETSVAGWGGLSRVTIAREVVASAEGVAALAMTHDGTAGAGSATHLPTGASASPVTPNAWYFLSAWAKRNTTGRSLSLVIQWYDAAGAALSTTNVRSRVSTADWVRMQGCAVAPAGAAFAQPVLQIDSGAAAGEKHYFDAVIFEAMSTFGTPAAGGTYDVFTGFVESWGLGYQLAAANKGDATVTLQCVDAFKLFQLAQATAYSAEVIEDDPVAYWKLIDAAGASSAADLGSNGQPLTLAGSPARTTGPTDRLYGHPDVMRLDGVNDRGQVVAPNDALRITGALSIEFWVNIRGSAAGAYLLYHGDTAVNDQGFFTILSGITGDPANLSLHWKGAGSSHNVNVSRNVWHHIVFVRDSTNWRVLIYVDGVLDSGAQSSAPITHSATGSGSASDTFFVGTSGAAGADFLEADLAHLAVYDKVLSPNRIAAHYAARFDALRAAASGTQLGWLLDAFGWPAGQRDLDAGNSTLQQHVPDGSFLEVMHARATDAESGILYIAPDGKVSTHQRHAQWTEHATSLATFGDGGGAERPYGGFEPAYDDAEVWNRVRVGRVGGSDQQAESAASQTKYGGTRSLEKTGLLIATDAEAYDAANYLLTRYKDARLRVRSITIDPMRDPVTLWPQVLARDIHLDRITLKRRPPGGGTITQDEHIIGLTHSGTAKPRRYSTTWRTTEADQFSYWILGDSTYGVLGSTSRLGY